MPANDAMDDVIVLVKKQIYIILLVNNIRKNILPVIQKLSLASLHTHHTEVWECERGEYRERCVLEYLIPDF